MGLRCGSTAVGPSPWIDQNIPTITMGFESHYDIAVRQLPLALVHRH
jgi:hypothetical protein